MRRLSLALLATTLLAGCGHPRGGLPPLPEVTGPENASGAVVVIHGGGWLGERRAFVVDARELVRRFDGEWRVYNVDHHSGPAGFKDLLAVVDTLRAENGPAFPICAVGWSAGGHWALTLAEHRDLACVVAEAAPTNLLTLGGDAGAMAAAAFGPDRRTLARWSPALHADTLRAPSLLVTAESDPLVRPDQAQALAAATPSARVIVLPTGDGGMWQVHSAVDAAAMRATIAEEQRFVADSMRGWAAAREAAASAADHAGGWRTTEQPAPATTASKHAADAAS